MRVVRHALFLAARYLLAAPGRSAVLVAGLTVALFLPTFTLIATERLEAGLMGRAEASPLLIGRKGSEFDLTMSSLYFRGTVGETLTWGARRLVTERGYGTVVPLYVRHSAGGVPVVGTTLEYLERRGLRVAEGRRMALLGEIVAGARVAERRGLSVGNKIRSDLTNLYNIAGAYPKVLEIVGVLEPTGTPDDDVFFADVKTTWMLDGRLHGHQEVTPELALNPDVEEDEVLEATAALFIFSEITERNRGTFHMHGDADASPVSALLVFPRDGKARAQLLGDLALDERRQAVQPVGVVGSILDIVLRIRDGLNAYFGLVAASTLLFFALVVLLSLRLRRSELALMRRMGSARSVIATMIAAEIGLVVAAAALLTLTLTALGLAILQSRLGA